jgi:DNA-binding beta-propeller fold protein YncE
MSNNKDFKVKNSIQPTVYQEGLGTVVSSSESYSLSGASYDSVSFSIASQETSPSDIFFKPDGTKMYILGTTGDDVNEYNLSTAWNVSTASYVQNFSVASQETAPRGIFFKPDGTKMYVAGTTGDSVYEYDLSTAWDISTSSYQQSFSVISQVGGPQCLFFKPDGTKMYVLDGGGDDANEYNLSTAWDISTSSYNQNFSVAPQEVNPSGFFFKPDGTKMYVIGTTGDDVNEYNLSTPWDISTGSYLRNFSVASQDTGPVGLFFKPDGTKMYVVGYTNDTIFQYTTFLSTATLDLSTGSVFDYTPTSDVQVTLTNPAASGTSSGATLLLSAVGTSYTITYPSTLEWPSGTAPTSPAIGDTDVITFNTIDGGTTYKSVLAIDGAK